MNRRCVITKLEGCSMSSGMLFQLRWNSVPDQLEQRSNWHLTMRSNKSSVALLILLVANKLLLGLRKAVNRFPILIPCSAFTYLFCTTFWLRFVLKACLFAFSILYATHIYLAAKEDNLTEVIDNYC